MDDKGTNELLKYFKALLAVQVQCLVKADDSIKPETLLARVGMSAREIAEVLGKNQAAVAKAIERARKTTRSVESPTSAPIDEPGASPARIA